MIKRYYVASHIKISHTCIKILIIIYVIGDINKYKVLN